jgi:hypothetical protein
MSTNATVVGFGSTQQNQNLRSSEAQLALEALLPFKEDVLKLLRSTLSDTEPQNTSLSTEILSSMAGWP